MSRHLLLGVSTLPFLAAAPAAMAQVVLPDITVEGPMTSITVQSEPLPAQLGVGSTVGIIRVMGVDIKVRADALVHTVTNNDLGDTDGLPTTPSDNAGALNRLKSVPLPGRPEAQGFLGGTVIVTGDSLNGFIYAKDVFTDMFENVVVGEATGINAATGRVSVQFMDLIPINDPRMPAVPPMNIYGFEIDPLTITRGTLVSAEGYFSKSLDGENLYYHTIEADSAGLKIDATTGKYPTNVSILRANCRVRGRNRDELQVRGGVHSPANGTVTIQVKVPVTTANPTGWRNAVGARGLTVAVADPATANPLQGEYRFDTSAENFGGTCPPLVRAVYTVSPNSLVSTIEQAPEIR